MICREIHRTNNNMIYREIYRTNIYVIYREIYRTNIYMISESRVKEDFCIGVSLQNDFHFFQNST